MWLQYDQLFHSLDLVIHEDINDIIANNKEQVCIEQELQSHPWTFNACLFISMKSCYGKGQSDLYLSFPSVGNAFLKYALQVKGQLGYVSWGQLGLIGVSWG